MPFLDTSRCMNYTASSQDVLGCTYNVHPRRPSDLPNIHVRSPLELFSALRVEITITSKVFSNRGSYLGRRPYLAFREICPVMELLQMVIQMAHYPTPVHELQIHLGECFKHLDIGERHHM